MNRRDFLRNSLVLPVASSVAVSSLARGESEAQAKKPRPGKSATIPSGLNPRLTGITCLRCKKVYPLTSDVADTGKGCPECLAQGFPSNVTFSFQPVTRKTFNQTGSGITRYRNLLPILDFPDLGEGNTPLVPLPTIAKKLGLLDLYGKDESRGPTGSHKDRMSGLVVARAAQLKRPGVVASSSGNGGHSLAAYAGSVGVPCLIYSTKKLSVPWRQAVEATGAKVVYTETSEERWVLAQEKVEKEGWYPVTNFLPTPVGSNAFSNQGCKTIGYEIAQDLSAYPPHSVIVPTCRGDLLWGLYEGFEEARAAKILPQVPRLYAVEPYPRLELILKGLDYRTKFEQPTHPMVSIGGKTSSYQAELGVRKSLGGACSVTTESVLRARDEIAALGMYLELSSAAALAGLYVLMESKAIKKGERVVLLCTSHGYKELQKPA